ncbi:hypothetical protein FIBSPDRAFT_970423 [Athelia psychrophila]|uniref:Uncharacterized protein n=1 Tax=Athelia psychrophila TaxID=1759441 RepID=A0A167SPT0_9AGAM|nr:hypothetical protein FIBSPDRAFT_970423 [Fibularhizoctonia sp. CBS 109695]
MPKRKADEPAPAPQTRKKTRKVADIACGPLFAGNCGELKSGGRIRAMRNSEAKPEASRCANFEPR